MSGRGLWVAIGTLGIGLALLLMSGDSGTTLGLASDDFGRVLYLGVLGAVIAAGLLGRRAGFGETTRNIALWLALIVLLVAGYQYRYELQDVAHRLTAGLVPGSPISLTAVDGRVSVMIEKRPNDHFEARGHVNGEPVTFMVDTGATTTVLTPRDAEKAGFDVSALSFDVPVATANGIARAALVTADEIALGRIVRSRQPLMIASPEMLGQSLLGMSFLSTLSGYDVRGDRLVLID